MATVTLTFATDVPVASAAQVPRVGRGARESVHDVAAWDHSLSERVEHPSRASGAASSPKLVCAARPWRGLPWTTLRPARAAQVACHWDAFAPSPKLVAIGTSADIRTAGVAAAAQLAPRPCFAPAGRACAARGCGGEARERVLAVVCPHLTHARPSVYHSGDAPQSAYN